MKPRHRRAALIVAGVAVLGIATALILSAFRQNLVFFYTPSDIAANKVPADRLFRIGGLVESGSLKREGVRVTFRVTDTANTVTVAYDGILPDLFREGKGVVAQGRIEQGGLFHASEVLAKHDENYMPPDAAHALEQAEKARRTLKVPAS
ncbi:MAG TPA: cytochrome c maturation protein CcmE [Burkholderiaceae bacterium]|jgi:cytochrome c-type biogenesis protein CcmE|nr:cytochrome c maturation protein CcmE [Burkholderiaceae bacterium]